MKKQAPIYFLIIVLISCSPSVQETTNKRAKALCDCFENKVVFTGELEDINKKISRLTEKDKTSIANCVIEVGQSIETDLEKLKDKKEKKIYTKSLIKSLVDCDCTDKLMDNIPYEEYGKLLKDAKNEMNEEKTNYREENFQ